MAKLSVVSVCPYLTDTDVKWRPSDYSANKMVKALKGQSFNGYFQVRIDGKWVSVTNENAERFRPVVHGILAKELCKRVEGSATLVPIPNSHVIAPDSADFRTRALAEGIAEASEGLLNCSVALVFGEALAKTHSTQGFRDPRFYRDKYQLISKPESPVVLIDDVFTSGAHLVGAAWKLADEGCNVVLAGTWAKSTKEQREPVFQVCEDELDLEEHVTDFNAIFD